MSVMPLQQPRRPGTRLRVELDPTGSLTGDPEIVIANGLGSREPQRGQWPQGPRACESVLARDSTHLNFRAA